MSWAEIDAGAAVIAVIVLIDIASELRKSRADIEKLRRQLYLALYPPNPVGNEDSNMRRSAALLHQINENVADVGMYVRRERH